MSDLFDICQIGGGEITADAFAVDLLRLDPAPDTRTRQGHRFALPDSTGTKGRGRIGVYDEAGLAVVAVDASATKINQLHLVVFAIARQLDWDALTQARLEALAAEAGYSWPEPGRRLDIAALAAAHGVAVPLLRCDLLRHITARVWRNPGLAQHFRRAMVALLDISRLLRDRREVLDGVAYIQAAVMAAYEAMRRAWPLRAPDEAALARHEAVLRAAYAAAYGWEAPPAAIQPRESRRTLRHHIRGWIIDWDMQRLYGSSAGLAERHESYTYTEELALELPEEDAGSPDDGA